MAKRWVNGSRAMVTVNSLFAGFSGALLVAILRPTDRSTVTTPFIEYAIVVGSGLAVLGVILFAIAAERVTDALDEGEVRKYGWSMQFHNVGVMCALGALSSVLYLYGWTLPYCALPLVPAFFYWGKDLWQMSGRQYREAYLARIDESE